ncbi:MAG: metallophosphoesterase family protein [Treponema sp.]|jgi:calcineurin-like phosphoesterase family protein|nr:metallophosphoesterase family protein [Treponema sp.]
MIFFTADTHFNHSNIINLCGRPFSNVGQMNETLIKNWNSCINNNDEIYVLGDFAFKGSVFETENIIKRLNGKKYLIRGNHDKFIENRIFNGNNFEWIKDYYVLNYQKIKFILFHYPIFEWDGYFGDAIHLYGHVHNGGNNRKEQERFKILGKRAINVGVDVNNFYPVSIEKIINELK